MHFLLGTELFCTELFCELLVGDPLVWRGCKMDLARQLKPTQWWMKNIQGTCSAFWCVSKNEFYHILRLEKEWYYCFQINSTINS